MLRRNLRSARSNRKNPRLGPGATRRAALIGCALALALGADAANAGDGDWEYRVTPYLWLATLTGDLGADGVSSSTDSGYSFWALDNLEGYFAVHFAANAERWGWFVDGLHIDYADTFQGPQLAKRLEVTGEIYEVGGSYALAAVPGLTVLGGARIVDLGVGVELTPGPDGRASQRFSDPFVGLEYRRPFGEKWYFDVRADIGGGASAQSESQFLALAGYRFSDRLEAFGGYRYLGAEFRDRILFDVTVAGPGLGFSWIW
ncbi:MAG TPA: hypothetical protein VE907_01190 [Gammaproteobacteria bacterium]|nr:hypothetical protein [Gammaproteobacteria bacterium]